MRRQHGSRLLDSAQFVLPAAVAVVVGWSYVDTFLNPTFPGDQGARLDAADRLIVRGGHRVWLPFLQAHLHLLYLAHAPIAAYLLVPFGYMIAALFSVAALCRAAIPARPTALVATALLVGVLGAGRFHWLGRSLYQEVIVLPLFLVLVRLYLFESKRRGLFLMLLAAGLLTREVFWIWWVVALGLDWKGLRERALLAPFAALGVIPAGWLALTGQSPLLARNAPENLIVIDGLLDRAVALVWQLMAQSSFIVLLCLSAVLVVLVGRRGARVPTFGRYYVFTLTSLAAVYGYVLLCDPWHATPGNPRILVPLFAHVIALGALAWSDAAALDGPWRRAALTLLVVGFVSMMRFDAIGVVVRGAAPRQGEGWEPTRLATSLSAREDWRRALGEVRRDLGVPDADGLAVAFVDIPHAEYLKYWVAPLLYDRRTRVRRGTAPPPADLVVAPVGSNLDGWRLRERVTVRPDIVRDLLVPVGNE